MTETLCGQKGMAVCDFFALCQYAVCDCELHIGNRYVHQILVTYANSVRVLSTNIPLLYFQQ